jgi:hypothetical protein
MPFYAALNLIRCPSAKNGHSAQVPIWSSCRVTHSITCLRVYIQQLVPVWRHCCTCRLYCSSPVPDGMLPVAWNQANSRRCVRKKFNFSCSLLNLTSINVCISYIHRTTIGNIFSTKTFKPALESTGDSLPEGKAAGTSSWLLTSTNVEAKNEWIFTSPPHISSVVEHCAEWLLLMHRVSGIQGWYVWIIVAFLNPSKLQQ